MSLDATADVVPQPLVTENTSEAIGAQLAGIDQLDVAGHHQPLSLDEETTIIAQALLEAS